MTIDQAERLIELVDHARESYKERGPMQPEDARDLDELTTMLRDFIANFEEDEPDDYSNLVTAKDLAPPAAPPRPKEGADPTSAGVALLQEDKQPETVEEWQKYGANPPAGPGIAGHPASIGVDWGAEPSASVPGYSNLPTAEDAREMTREFFVESSRDTSHDSGELPKVSDFEHAVQSDEMRKAFAAVLVEGRAFVVEEAVPAGTLPPETMVFVKAKL